MIPLGILSNTATSAISEAPPETTVYSPPRLVAQATSEANKPDTSNYQNEVTDTNTASAVVTSTSTSPGKDVITLQSDTTVPMTVGSTTYQTYDFTDVKTIFGSNGTTVSVSNNSENWVSPIVGIVKTTFTVTAYNPDGSILSTYKETDQLVSLAAGDHLYVFQQPSDTAVAATIAPPVVVQALNASNIVDNSLSGTLTASIASGTAGAVLSGATTSFSGGVATFSGLSINLPGTYTLTFSSRQWSFHPVQVVQYRRAC